MFRSIGLGRLLTLCTGLHYSVKPTIASAFDNTLIISVNGEVSSTFGNADEICQVTRGDDVASPHSTRN